MEEQETTQQTPSQTPPPAQDGETARVVEQQPAELLADFGHQLRDELNAIVGAAGLLSATASSNEERELASIIEAGADQVARLVDDVLDAAVIRSDEFELALHPFDVRSSVEGCLSLVVGAAGAKGLDLSFHPEPDVPGVIVGDSRRLDQILFALLRSAVVRTERGGVHVELSCEQRTDHVALTFKVRDTGRGVPARILRAALSDEPGSKAGLEAGDSLVVLSLSICRRLVEMMDGELRVEQGGVEAGPDAGTTFAFTILAEVVPAPTTSSHLTLEAMRVLVVAADATERRVLELQAELWGAPSTSATPADALELVRSGNVFDLALVEHRRPVVDGLAISTALRSLRGPDQLPIVLIASAPPGPEEAGAADGGLVQATLTKPVTARKLHDVMAQVGTHQQVPPPARGEMPPGALRVLVADDNALNQNTLKRLVAKLGHQVDVVSNGREAVSAVAKGGYDAVLMDVLMPEMDGLAAAEAICRRWPRGTRPRLIALTALAAPGDQERCMRAGFDDYMSKPIHLDELSEALTAAAGWRTTP
jgi:CheY-like chemotaxis protein